MPQENRGIPTFQTPQTKIFTASASYAKSERASRSYLDDCTPCRSSCIFPHGI